MCVHMSYRAWNMYTQTAAILRSAMQRINLSHTCDPWWSTRSYFDIKTSQS